MDFKQPGLFTRAQAHLDGFDDNELRRAVGAKQIYAVRPGCYVTKLVYKSMTREEQHLLLARAVATQSSTRAVLSHVTAAVALGIDVWEIRLDQAHLTVNCIGAGRSSRRRMLHGSKLSATECATSQGLSITNAARTIVDLALTEDFEKAVCAGDSALHIGVVTPTELRKALDGARLRTGKARAIRAVEYMSGRSESVGESRTRVLMRLPHFPTPLLNEWVYNKAGILIGRVDFLFDDAGVIGEFDGAGKYGEQIITVKKTILAEKARENRLREEGWLVVRFDWGDLTEPGVIANRILDAVDKTRTWPTPSGSHSSERR